MGFPMEIPMGNPMEIPMGVPMGIPMRFPMGNPMGNPMGIPMRIPMVEPWAQNTFPLPMVDLKTLYFPSISVFLPYSDIQSSRVIKFIWGPQNPLPPKLNSITE